jgi:PAS domain S-box-containing protein
MTILVVDDNEEHLYLLQALLSGNDYQVVTAPNGAEALAKARQNPPDLIVSDILMPVMDGFALCREWKKDERLRHIPFVFYTGTYTDERDQKFALGLGAEQFIVKPEEPELFLRAIREVIQHVQRSPARVPIEAPRQDENGYLKQYNEALIRKLEAKTEQLAQANRQMESNITERKLAEAEIIRAKEEWERTFDAVPDLIALIDVNHRIIRANRAMAARMGSTPEQVVGQPCYEAMHGLSAPADFCPHSKLLASGKEQRAETVEERLHGTFDVSVTPLRDATGHLVGSVHVARDITERKRAEAERVALDQQLRQAQKMESVGQLAGGVAHDFNNILTGISGYTELALERLEAASPMREDLAEVLRLSKRAAELTRQLLAFSRRQTLEPQVLNINAMIADAAKMLKRVLSEDIDLHFAPAPDLGNVRADPMQIEQVLMNLAINARDAMPAGGKLTIETANVELDVEYTASHISVVPGRYVMMAVSDTGHGMDAATQSRLFEPFFTTKDKSKGTGLGLATAYGIVKQHGGHIWVYSEPGKGATFKIYLPRVEEAASVVNPPVEPSMTRGEETLLIVEDEPAVGAIAERALKARGYTVLIARSAEEAESLFSEHHARISLLLTDVVLPGINGPKLYERLRTRDPSLKVLYMSGHTDNATVHQGVLDADVAFMQKPFTLATIARKVRQVLDS